MGPDPAALSVIVGRLKSKGDEGALPPSSPEGDEESPGGDEAIQSAAEELIGAIQAGDVASVASALRAAFEILESEPHDEGGE